MKNWNLDHGFQHSDDGSSNVKSSTGSVTDEIFSSLKPNVNSALSPLTRAFVNEKSKSLSDDKSQSLSDDKSSHQDSYEDDFHISFQKELKNNNIILYNMPDSPSSSNDID